ncbi:MAG TPA: TonB-dependent receptor, partial [Burkholderiales bacterium]|nr:TonB-dependent receptor [Burkholderiales bacterium]
EITSRSISSAFAGYQASFDRRHFVQADMRFDKNSQFGTYRTGNAGYAYQIDSRYKIRFDMGTAFKAPTFNDLYYPGFSNPNLLPERSASREVGLDYRSESRHVGLTYFDNHIRDMIILDQSFVPQNIDSARIHGMELSYQESFSDYGLDCGLTLQNPVDSQTGFMLQRHARQFGSIKLSREIDAWRAGLEWFASGYRFDSASQNPATRLGGYNFVNLTASRDLSKSWRLDARWNNFFNKHYELVQYYNTPGSNLFVSLTYKM